MSLFLIGAALGATFYSGPGFLPALLFFFLAMHEGAFITAGQVPEHMSRTLYRLNQFSSWVFAHAYGLLMVVNIVYGMHPSVGTLHFVSDFFSFNLNAPNNYIPTYATINMSIFLLALLPAHYAMIWAYYIRVNARKVDAAWTAQP